MKAFVTTRANLLVFVRLIVIVMLCCALGRAQSGKTAEEKPVATPSPTTAPVQTTAQASLAGVGVINNSVYQNDYFGLRLTIPAGWNVHGEDVKKEITERGKSSIVPKDEQEKTRFDAAIDRTLNLLTISKLPLGTPGQFNAVFMMVAEPVPLSATGPFYMQQLKSVLKQAQTPVNFLANEEVETINGVPFHTLAVTLGPPENLVRQKYYVVIKKGYALGLITTVVSDSDNELMSNILKSVKVQ